VPHLGTSRRCLRALERLAAFEGERGAGAPVGGDADDVWSLAVFAINEQRGVTVRGRFQRSC
jgi:hypothetical protein